MNEVKKKQLTIIAAAVLTLKAVGYLTQKQAVKLTRAVEDEVYKVYP